MQYLTTGQVAKACQVSLVAVKNWIREGKLKAFQTPGGHFRIPSDEFRRFQAVHRMGYLTTGQAAKACQVSLVAVKNWIKEGKLNAFQTPGGHFRIPADELQRFRAAHSFPEENGEPSRILVVDDDPQSVEVVLLALSATQPPPKLEAAFNGYEGLLKVGTFRPHLLMLDLRMPELDGFEVCRRIKSDPATQDTKVLAITAYPEEFAKEKILNCGADAFLAKPFKITELIAQVRQLMPAGH